MALSAVVLAHLIRSSPGSILAGTMVSLRVSCGGLQVDPCGGIVLVRVRPRFSASPSPGEIQAGIVLDSGHTFQKMARISCTLVERFRKT